MLLQRKSEGTQRRRLHCPRHLQGDWAGLGRYLPCPLHTRLSGGGPAELQRRLGCYLHSLGYRRYIVPDSCPVCYTVAQFADEHPEGTYILALSGHVVCVQDGVIYDSWHSENETVLYYWHRESEE